MNPHYHPYTELPSPHSPAPDGSGYSNGHHMMGSHEHSHHHGHPHPHPASFTPHHPMHHHQHHINNNNNNNNNNNSTTGSGPGGPGPGVKVCAGCNGKILERFLLHAADRYWHNACLKCTCCGAMLADLGASCYTRSNMILCKNDYLRLFGSTGACSACGQTIPASEFVMRASSGGGVGPQHHVFHLKCFACSKCGSPLVPGDRYYLLGGTLVCEQDWHKLAKANSGPQSGPQAQSPANPPLRKGKVGRPRRSRD